MAKKNENLEQTEENATKHLSQTPNAMFFPSAVYGQLEKNTAQILLSHIVKGEESEALKLIDTNPRLLLISSQATDYSDRSYQGYTPFQAALLCHDVALWKKIEPYFDQLPNGQEEKVKQFTALFPEGLPEQKPYNFDTLVEVISNSSEADIWEAYRNRQNNTPVSQALRAFRNDFTALAKKEVFFNPLHLIEAARVYDKHSAAWSIDQCDVFCSQVFGYIQRYLPAGYAQAICQGITSIVKQKKPLVRSFEISSTKSYFPLADSGGLGFDFAIYGEYERLVWVTENSPSSLEKDALTCFKTLCSMNKAELLRLEHRLCQDEQSIRDTVRSYCTIS